jgi:hypothetical protein
VTCTVAERGRLAPVERFDGDVRASAADDHVVAEGGDDARPRSAPEPGDGGEVEMVVVAVGDQDGVDRRQVGQRHAGGIDPAGAEPAQRAGARRPDRVDQDVLAGQLHEEAGMADQRDPEAVDALGRGGVGEGARVGGGPFGAGFGEAPAQDVAERAVRGVARDEEAGAVEMIGRGAVPIGFGHR